MYIVESNCIRKVTIATGIITTIVSSNVGISNLIAIAIDSVGKYVGTRSCLL